MAYDKVVDSAQLDADLKIVADAIREKGGTTEQLSFPQGMADAVDAIETGITPTGAIEITENGTYDVAEYANAEVNVSGSEEFVGIKYIEVTEDNLPTIVDARTIPQAAENRKAVYANLFRNTDPNPNGGAFGFTHTIYTPSFISIKSVSQYMFSNCIALENLIGDFSPVEIVGAYSFRNCRALKEIPYMPNIVNVETNAFQGCTGLKKIKFYKTPTDTISGTAFNGCTNITDIYVPWSEGEVANAPWSAVNATIHYNTVYDENHNPIIQEV